MAKIKNILISQPPPERENDPYYELAKKFGEYPNVLRDLIFAHDDLKEMIEPYMKTVKPNQKGRKLLPPAVIEAICERLGY